MREVLEAIHAIARRSPGRVAITDAQGAFSYGELTQAIAATAQALADSAPVVGLLMPRDRRHVAADLALAALGRTIVPLPDFFSPGQWQHMITDAAIGVVVTTAELRQRLGDPGVPVVVLEHPASAPWPTVSPSRRVIYTSGTTGAPKGVLLDESAMAASLRGLERAVQAEADDIHLSVLPFSLLLEQLAGLLLPLKLGARVHIAASPQSAPAEAEQVGATTSVLVPELLAGWVAWLRHTGRQAPASLRFVAVGGAPVGETLGAAAWSLGLPVHEGYGLSECCSVVAVNRPGRRSPGSVGHPLDGVRVSVEDGEIVVRGPTVMTGYLGGAPTGGVWRTGDCGRLLPDGSLQVLGRKDDVVVTANGRNIHPEWIEPMLLADPAIQACAVLAGRAGLLAAIVARPEAKAMSPAQWLPRLQQLTRSAPAYARPLELSLIPAAEARANALFTMDGRPRRRRIAHFLKEAEMNFHEMLITETHRERQDFLSIPLIARTVAEGADLPLYLSFLHSAYHHVRHTVPLLQAALAACGPDDAVLAAGLREYVAEETGHDEWILDDIVALGGDGQATRRARPPVAVRAMVATAYHLIAEEGPYALLGMVHVLEGMSVALAIQAAQSIRARLGAEATSGGGFSYLTSHGGLDVGHVEGFARLLDAIDTPARRRVVVDAARDFYGLYGNVFRALAPRPAEISHAA
ncbi:AMP-binding protein [Magnetospirillum sp. 64-120]|uniref:AMP-binding protein n=1 Tax=Magnetospirillum sp. 64-120 TaxID=1895778 RepID=UPI00092883CC|nr:AMP-binding protein [Magnetospirillum sp. 64-120]OJX71798.1 MAG: hypothetical protein BGO92_04185 [Magnetospirillum sp. 64-120]